MPSRKHRHSPGGMHTYRPRLILDWRAAYGLELMRINAEADLASKRAGHFIPATYPTEEEFKTALRLFGKGRWSNI